jgi:excisionase family DNA binding protein
MTQTSQFLSPRQAARVLGASESSLKRWVDAGELVIRRTAGGHRRIPAAEVVRFARREGLTLQDADVLGRTPPVPTRKLTSAVTRALIDGDGDAVQRLLLRAHLDGLSVAALADGPLRLALEEIGRLWLDDPEGVAREHHATVLIMRAAEALRGVLPATRPNAPTAVGGGPAGDPYLLPSLLASLVLQEAGWRTIDLGPDTPDAALIAAAHRHGATLVWRSYTGELEPVAAATDLATLCRRLAPCRVVAGGWRAHLLEGLDDVANLARPTSMVDLAALARTEA